MHTNQELIDITVKLGLGKIAKSGALVVDTTPNTGRSTQEGYMVQDESNESTISWGKTNQALSRELADPLFAAIKKKVLA